MRRAAVLFESARTHLLEGLLRRHHGRDGRARNLLAVAEIEGGVGPAVAAASARQVLASEDWSETEARELAHGFWLRYQIEWNLGFAVSGPQFECSLTCEPVVLPKIGVATRLKQLARKR